MIRLIRLVILALGLTTAAVAQPIPGAEAPGFVGARALWLAGDDLPALQALAGLAREGNTAAQMLLSQIALATYTHAHVTAGMDRRDRIALLRQEGGLSGRDWMQAAAEAHPLATAYWASRAPIADDLAIAENVRLFVQYGDRRHALLAISESVNYATHDRARNAEVMARIYADSLGPAGIWLWTLALSEAAFRGPTRLPATVRTMDDFLEYLGQYRTPEAAFAWQGTSVLRRFLADPQDPPYGVTWTEVSSYEDTVRAMIANLPDVAPLAGFCAENCPDAVAACQVDVAEIYSLGDGFPYPFASPLPAVISDSEYQTSRRFYRDIRERLGQSVASRPGSPLYRRYCSG